MADAIVVPGREMRCPAAGHAHVCRGHCRAPRAQQCTATPGQSRIRVISSLKSNRGCATRYLHCWTPSPAPPADRQVPGNERRDTGSRTFPPGDMADAGLHHTVDPDGLEPSNRTVPAGRRHRRRHVGLRRSRSPVPATSWRSRRPTTACSCLARSRTQSPSCSCAGRPRCDPDNLLGFAHRTGPLHVTSPCHRRESRLGFDRCRTMSPSFLMSLASGASGRRSPRRHRWSDTACSVAAGCRHFMGLAHGSSGMCSRVSRPGSQDRVSHGLAKSGPWTNRAPRHGTSANVRGFALQYAHCRSEAPR